MSKVPKRDPELFSVWEQPTLIHDSKTLEFNPINPFVKVIPTDYDEHLRQPYYYRDIMLKKKAQAEMGPKEFKNRFGVYPESYFKVAQEKFKLYDEDPPNMKDFFVDDGQTRYESAPDSQVIIDWQKDSNDLAKRLKKEGNKPTKVMAKQQDQKVTLQQSQINAQQSLNPISTQMSTQIGNLGADFMQSNTLSQGQLSPDIFGKRRLQGSDGKEKVECWGPRPGCGEKGQGCGLIYHQLQPKVIAEKKEKVDFSKQKQLKLEKQSKAIMTKEQAIIDASIKDAMKFYYAPFDGDKWNQETKQMDGKINPKTNEGKGFGVEVLKYSDVQKKLSKNNSILMNKPEAAENLERTKTSVKKMPSMERKEQEAKDKENAEKMAKQWKENAERLMVIENRRFLDIMSYRHIQPGKKMRQTCSRGHPLEQQYFGLREVVPNNYEPQIPWRTGHTKKQAVCFFCQKDIDNGELRLNCSNEYKDANGKTCLCNENYCINCLYEPNPNDKNAQEKAIEEAQKSKDHLTQDFSDIIKNSCLEVMTINDMKESNLDGQFLSQKAKRMQTSVNEYDPNRTGTAQNRSKTGQPKLPVIGSKDGITSPQKWLEPHKETIQNCRNILQNQKLYADTILMNARTGKQLKSSVSTSQPSKRNSGTSKSGDFGAKGGKQNTFQQYQNNLYSQTSNKQIEMILNESKRYNISQFKEELGIEKYIKKKFYATKHDSLQIGSKGFEEIKKRHFSEILQQMSQKPPQPEEEEICIFDKISKIDSHAKNIYRNVLDKSEGLNARGGKMEVYQFDQDAGIKINMMHKDVQKQQIDKVKDFERHQQDTNEQMTNSVNNLTRANNSIITSFKSDSQSVISIQTLSQGDKNKLSTIDIKERGMDKINEETLDEKTDADSQIQIKKSNRLMDLEPSIKNSVQGSQRRVHSLKGSSVGRGSSVSASKQKGQLKSVQQVYLDSDYWYHKGVVLNQMGENKYALNCYNQALVLNAKHKASIFNLACAYEKLGHYEEAIGKFMHAIEVQKDWPDAHYGLALCCLKLKRFVEAVEHIENAKRYSIEEYKQKMEKRRQRQQQKIREMEDSLAQGTKSVLNKVSMGSGSEKEKETKRIEKIHVPEDDDPQDELYIDPATKRNEGVSTHIMYVRALCHREVKNYNTALESYARVMKREDEISDYEKMIEKKNFKDLTLKTPDVEGPGFPGWRIDIYSHFKREKLLKDNNRLMMVNLREYYTWKEGWHQDQVQNIIRDLQRIRFFNRFDKETLYQMMKKTDLRVIQKHNLLFLEPDQCAIIINGNLNMFSHKDDVATPILQAIYNPGDIIGNQSIDGGNSRDTHSWIIAYKDCDILLMNVEYNDYLWDKMKSSSDKNYIAKKIQACPWLKNLTEQSIYTLAYDLLYYKKFDFDQKICPQAIKSVWNLDYIKKQKDAFKNFQETLKNDKEYQEVSKIFEKENNPHWWIDLCIEGKLFIDYHESLMREINRREGNYGKHPVPTDEEKAEQEKKKQKEKEELEKKKIEGLIEPEEPFDPYKLEIPAYIMDQIKPKEEDDKKKIQEEDPKSVKPNIAEESKLDSEKYLIKKREPFFKQMVKYSERTYEVNQKILNTMLKKLEDHFKQYKTSRGLFPKDSDGIYFLIEGSVTVKNDFNPGYDKTMGQPKDLYNINQNKNDAKNSVQKSKGGSSAKQDRPEILDVLGAEKFLQVQGYSYYGSIYSTTEKKGGTTCGFIDENYLYLLPFYDLYKMKEDLQARYKERCDKLKKISSDNYKYTAQKLLN